MDRPDEFLGEYRVRWTTELRADVYLMGLKESREDEPNGQPVARLRVLSEYAGPVQYKVTTLVNGEEDRTEIMLSNRISAFLAQVRE